MSDAADKPQSAEGAPLDDVIVVSYNQRDRLLRCLASVTAASPASHIIVVDNDSEDGSAEAARDAFPHADVVALDTNVGFGAAVNHGVARGDAPHILLLNNDARLGPESLDRLHEALRDPGVAAAGPMLLGTAGEVELSLDRTLTPWNEAGLVILEALYRDGTGPATARVRRRYAHSRDVLSLSGACILLRREAFEQVGGFDERFFMYAEDVDLCVRLREEGWKLRYVAESVVEHDRGASTATAPTATALHYRRSQIAFYRKHSGALAAQGLRFYLALRFATKRLFARNEDDRQLATDLLGVALRESGE